MLAKNRLALHPSVIELFENGAAYAPQRPDQAMHLPQELLVFSCVFKRDVIRQPAERPLYEADTFMITAAHLGARRAF